MFGGGDDGGQGERDAHSRSQIFIMKTSLCLNVTAKEFLAANMEKH